MDGCGVHHFRLFLNCKVEMKKTFYILMLALMLPFLRVEAQGNSDAQIKQQINKIAASLKTMQCDFVQTKHLKMLNNDVTSQGRMYYQQSDRLRWEYQKPYSYVFILNKDKVVIKNSKRKDVIDVNQNKVFREIARIMMSSMVGSCLSDEKSFKTTIATTNTEWVATMIPVRKEMKQMFQKVILHFSRQKSYVTKVELLEKNGDKTMIDLKNVRVNETVSPSLFAVN